MAVDVEQGCFSVNGTVVNAGDVIAIDGTTGVVTTDDVALVEPELSDFFERVLAWCDERRRLGVRANADVGEDARTAVELGAEGIGLCRTEHILLSVPSAPSAPTPPIPAPAPDSSAPMSKPTGALRVPGRARPAPVRLRGAVPPPAPVVISSV